MLYLHNCVSLRSCIAPLLSYLYMGSCDSGDSSLLTLEKQLEMFRRVNDYLLFHAHGEEAETEVERRLNVLVTSEGGGAFSLH